MNEDSGPVAHERSLAAPAFPDDDGVADRALADALGDDDAVLAAYGTARVYTAVVATLGDVGRTVDGADKNADMAAVMMRGADGRQALLTFSSVATLLAWDPQARPVAVRGRDAARAARAEGASALLLDLGSPGFTVIETVDTDHLAAGDTLVRTGGATAWVRAAPDSEPASSD